MSLDGIVWCRQVKRTRCVHRGGWARARFIFVIIKWCNLSFNLIHGCISFRVNKSTLHDIGNVGPTSRATLAAESASFRWQAEPKFQIFLSYS